MGNLIAWKWKVCKSKNNSKPSCRPLHSTAASEWLSTEEEEEETEQEGERDDLRPASTVFTFPYISVAGQTFKESIGQIHKVLLLPKKERREMVRAWKWNESAAAAAAERCPSAAQIPDLLNSIPQNKRVRVAEKKMQPKTLQRSPIFPRKKREKGSSKSSSRYMKHFEFQVVAPKRKLSL